MRRAGHIFNPVCKSILYGVDADYLHNASISRESQEQLIDDNVNAFESALRSRDEQSQLVSWRSICFSTFEEVMNVKDRCSAAILMYNYILYVA